MLKSQKYFNVYSYKTNLAYDNIHTSIMNTEGNLCRCDSLKYHLGYTVYTSNTMRDDYARVSTSGHRD